MSWRWLGLILLLTGCQTSMIRQFDDVKMGMDKSQVLFIVGNPTQTQRFHGKDRWFYTFQENHIHFQKEIQFFEGTAIYIGEVWEPPAEQSAVAQDARNAEKNRVLDEQIAKEIDVHRHDYENYEAKTKGEDKVRYVPTFVPVH
ncbi:MAG TPA: outer membrane protein assembly factor BamE [Bdellovibrio sp.]|nr:outer membrane protein assembly factor BamE [Bdellovibrio sp.]